MCYLLLLLRCLQKRPKTNASENLCITHTCTGTYDISPLWNGPPKGILDTRLCTYPKKLFPSHTQTRHNEQRGITHLWEHTPALTLSKHFLADHTSVPAGTPPGNRYDRGSNPPVPAERGPSRTPRTAGRPRDVQDPTLSAPRSSP